MSTIEVNTRKSMKDAIDEKYDVIIVTGELANEVIAELNDGKKQKINKLSNVSLIAGIFVWPLLIAGLAGKILSKDDFKKYSAKIENNNIILTRK